MKDRLRIKSRTAAGTGRRFALIGKAPLASERETAPRSITSRPIGETVNTCITGKAAVQLHLLNGKRGLFVSSRKSRIAILSLFLRQNSRYRGLFQPFGKALEDAERRPGSKACSSRTHQHQLGPAKQAAESQGFG